MEEEIDFDTISAMLDEETEDNNIAEESETPCKPSPSNEIQNNEDSSDDDIDESELEKLATLMEEEESFENTNENLSKAPEPLEESVQVKSDEYVPGKSDDPEITEDTNQPDECESSEDEDDGLAAQMKLLQEQMKLLEGRLNKKKKDQTPIKKKPVENSYHNNVSTIKEKVNLSKKEIVPKQKVIGQSSKENVSEHSKLKSTPAKSKTLKEFNIFDIIDGDRDKIQNPEGKKESEPWERKKSRPAGSISKEGIPSPKPKISNPEADRKVNQKLKATVVKIASKVTTCVAPAKKSTNADDMLEKELFGDDSGSDWEDLEGEKTSRLTKEGKDMDKLLKKTSGQRVAHNPTYDQESMMKKKETNWNTNKPSFYGNTPQNCLPSGRKPLAETAVDISRDPFSGIRITKPLISSLEMKSRMSGRKLVKMSHLHRRVNTSDTDSDWVTVGVIVSKSEPKMSSKNTQYSIWKLSDLEDCERLVTMFLFGSVHKELWKHTVGSVVGLLNPTHLKNSEKYQKKDLDECSITIDSPQKLMMMGFSKDFGICKSTTKAGKKCNNVINICKGDYCSYHVQAAYKKTSAKRSELQAGFTGVTPKSFEKKIFNKGSSTVMYGGQSFTSASNCSAGTKKAKNQISLKALQHHTINQGPKGKVNTLKVHNLMPEMNEVNKQLQEYEDKMAEKEKEKNEKHKAFHNLLSTPTLGSTNFVKHLAKKENFVTEDKTEKKPTLFVSPSEFLKNAERERRKKKQDEKQENIYKKLGIKTVETSSGFKPSPLIPITAQEAVKKMPTLGRGFDIGDDIELDFSKTPTFSLPKTDKNKVLAKKKAVAKIKATGGIRKEDPNAVKGLKSPETQERLKRRLEDTGSDSGDEKGKNGEPAKKKSRLLGNLDLDDPEVQKILKAKSSHAAALTQEEQERQDQYFEVLEKKEAMEEKMASITKVKCKSYSCKQCVYTAFSQSQFCKDQGHNVKVNDAWKRFFKCKACKNRTVTLDKLPKTNCRNCGSSNFERTSMLKEKKGPTLPSEELLLRGEERKYVNS